MASTKSLLKAAKADLDGRKYEACIDKAQEVLKADPENYFALVVVHLSLASLTVLVSHSLEGRLKGSEKSTMRKKLTALLLASNLTTSRHGQA